MDKEYGGYLTIELNSGKEYYRGSDVMAFNCARSAIAYVIQKNNFSKLYLPVYMCESVRNRLNDDIEIQYYNINRSMKPEVAKVEDSAVIMIPNYFGVSAHDIKRYDNFQHIIFDNTQAFFQNPIMRKGVYNIYSCRKFFGVCDGAYLVGNEVKKKDITRYVPKFASYMLDALTYGTNALYEMSLANEQQLEQNEIYGISELSQKILQGIDYQKVTEIRRQNFYKFHQQLQKYNEISFTRLEECVPMVYPFLFRSENLRKKLIDKKIYVPQWWKYILQEGQANEYERYLSKYLLPLPIDQRYGTDDIYNITNIVKKYLNVEVYSI